MSEFKVEVVKVDNVIDHPNADRLTIVSIGGYECIANKKDDGSWRYQPGDLVVYIPEGSVLPEWLLKKMGFWDEDKQKGMLSGSKGNRVKAIKLRGTVSQGVLYPVWFHKAAEPKYDKHYIEGAEVLVESDAEARLWDTTLNSMRPSKVLVEEGDDVAEFLNIIKYEPPIPVHMKGQITGGLFGYTKSYDIENAQKYNKAIPEGTNIICTEKVHGTLCQIGFLNDAPEEMHDKLFQVKDGVHAYVTSKGLAKKGIIQQNNPGNADNLYVKAYQDFIAPKAEQIVERFCNKNGMDILPDRKWRLYVFGEIFGVGVQDLAYGRSTPDFRVFDVAVKIMDASGKTVKEGFLGCKELFDWTTDIGLKMVDIIYNGPFISLEHLKQYRDGPTLVGDNQHIREGIVIKPYTEMEYKGLPDNRLQLKYVSPDYLLRKGGTEYN